MSNNAQSIEARKTALSRHWKAGESRSLNADERISFTVFSLYLCIFCLCAFLFWPSLPMQILGGASAVMGLLLFVTALLNRGQAPRKHSRYTLRWYMLSFLTALVVLVALRSAVRHVSNHVGAVSMIYGSLLLLFIVFRKAMIQILMAFSALVFIVVTVLNWNAALAGQMGFMDVMGECGRTVFKVQHIKELANTLIAGNYMGYLNKVDYRNKQINMVATRTVAGTGDDELKKTLAILDFVSNDLHYVSDPDDGLEFAKDPVNTIISGGGDCEDKTVVLCSMLESVGVTTYMAFTSDHVFALVGFSKPYPELKDVPRIDVDGATCYILDAADPGAEIGYGSAWPGAIERIFEVRSKTLMPFSILNGI